jgi:hypothetical protein
MRVPLVAGVMMLLGFQLEVPIPAGGFMRLNVTDCGLLEVV